MSEFRVTKGWSLFGATNIEPYMTKSKAERTKYDRIADKMIRNIPSKSAEDLEIEMLEFAAAKAKAKEKRDLAIKEGRLKDKRKKKR